MCNRMNASECASACAVMTDYNLCGNLKSLLKQVVYLHVATNEQNNVLPNKTKKQKNTSTAGACTCEGDECLQQENDVTHDALIHGISTPQHRKLRYSWHSHLQQPSIQTKQETRNSRLRYETRNNPSALPITTRPYTLQNFSHQTYHLAAASGHYHRFASCHRRVSPLLAGCLATRADEWPLCENAALPLTSLTHAWRRQNYTYVF